MKHSATHGPNYRRKSHNTYPINENFRRKKTEIPYHIDQEYIQANKHTCCTICTFYIRHMRRVKTRQPITNLHNSP
jgi:hypothetical protein